MQTELRRLRIGICQFPVSNQPQENGRFMRDQVRQAAGLGADLAHFPECAMTGYPGYRGYEWSGYDWEAIRTESESLLELAAELKIWIAFGSAHRLSGATRPHNCVYVFNSRGEIEDRYDKRFLTQGGQEFYTPGDHPTIVSVKGISIGIIICYEKWFPELLRDYARRGVECILDSVHSQERDFSLRSGKRCLPDEERALWIAHARLNHFWMSVSNHCRPDQDNTSFLVDPDGGLRKLPFLEPAVEVFDIEVGGDIWDPSAPYRDLALSGAMHNGETLNDPRSRDRKSL